MFRHEICALELILSVYSMITLRKSLNFQKTIGTSNLFLHISFICLDQNTTQSKTDGIQ